MTRMITIKIDMDDVSRLVADSARVCLKAHQISLPEAYIREIGNNVAGTIVSVGDMEHTEDRLELWAHIVSEHCNMMPTTLSISEMLDYHDGEHHGPGGICNHDENSRHHDPLKIGLVLRESDPPRTEPMSMLSKNNTIELPAGVVKDIKAAPGEYVYFVKSKDGYRMLNERQMDDALDCYEGSFCEAADNEGARIAAGSDD